MAVCSANLFGLLVKCPPLRHFNRHSKTPGPDIYHIIPILPTFSMDFFFHRHIQLSHLVVRCGDWDLTNNNELHRHQDRNVDRVIIHPLYTGNKTIEYNFALLHVNEEFNLDRHISPICLPDIPNQKTGKKPTNTYYI